MKILITGANGFIGKNLVVHLSEDSGFEVFPFVRGSNIQRLQEMLAQVDAVVHLAGENRPNDVGDFVRVNVGLTEEICNQLVVLDKKIPLIFASSVQALCDNPYGRSKLAAERIVEKLSMEQGNPVAIYRLPGVFGKWCKPNYNSVVATFCYNKARDLNIQISGVDTVLRLIYVDDLVTSFLARLVSSWTGILYPSVTPEYKITLGALAKQIEGFKQSRNTLICDRVGSGLTRALHATYLSYLPSSMFSYTLPVYSDPRGVFVEMLKTPDTGQFSFFTTHPGVIRGGHYHHSKTEKFLVIRGSARFRFKNIVTNEYHMIETSGDIPQVVETVPGWTHDITNMGKDEMLVLLWANEVFDQNLPDTVKNTL